MNLVIDIGNTFSKIAIFNNAELINLLSVRNINNQHIKNLKKNYISLDKAIVSTVKNIAQETEIFLKQNFDTYINFDCSTSIPIENCYQTKKTLGNDRVAAAVGAFCLYPDSNTLIIDAGTAITYDFINEKNQYLG